MAKAVLWTKSHSKGRTVNYHSDQFQKISGISRVSSAPQPFKLRLETEPHAGLPDIFETHSDFDNVASCIKFCRNSTRGRYSIADRDIEPGQVLFIDRPKAWFLAGTRWASNCHHCCKPLCYTLVPSPLQANVIFCSIGCCHKAMSSYHVQEAKFNFRLVLLNTRGSML